MIDSLQKAGLGCELYGTFIGCIVYADDVILLSGSVVKLQKMLDICYCNGLHLDVVFNAKKSALFAFGLHSSLCKLHALTNVLIVDDRWKPGQWQNAMLPRAPLYKSCCKKVVHKAHIDN